MPRPLPSDLDLPARRRPSGVTRRRAVGLVAAAVGGLFLAGCNDDPKWHAINITGTSPDLALTFTRAADGKVVTAADYRGKIVLLYFGYTFCPDVCPTTLYNIDKVLKRLGDKARNIAVLFVTVDPNRDTLKQLKSYAANFGPEVEGLRGTPDQLAALARRFRILYSVSPATADHPYEVTHSSAIYVFDGAGRARLLIPSLATADTDISGTVADLHRLIEEKQPPGFWSRLVSWV